MADYYLCPILEVCPHWLSKCKDAGCQHIEAVEMRTIALLGQRGQTHGDFRAMSTRIQQIKTVMRMGSKWIDMSEPQKEALELIATKIGRIIEGDPEFKDHWDDLGGYATKASEFCRKEPTSV